MLLRFAALWWQLELLCMVHMLCRAQLSDMGNMDNLKYDYTPVKKHGILLLK